MSIVVDESKMDGLAFRFTAFQYLSWLFFPGLLL
jgi:hypothetical protein